MKTDTHSLIQEEMDCRWSRMTAREKLERCAALFESGRIFAERLVKERNPSLHGVDLEMAVFRFLYRSSLPPEVLDDAERHLRNWRTKNPRQSH